MYMSDPKFVSNYHGNTSWSAEQCAQDSWDNIKDLELHLYDFGYIAVNRFDLIDRLAGFFIKPGYRNSQVKEQFFNEVYKLLPETFMTCVHSSNIKAIEFLATRGKITRSDNITTYLVFRQGK